jgi:hypothetical protein
MQENNIKIVERVHGYSDNEMIKYCEMLLSLTQKTITNKKGIEQRKYKDDPETTNKLTRSIEYYKTNPRTELKFRDYQLDIIDKGSKILSDNGLLYLAMEVRTGKTLTSLGIADKVGSKNVLFITKKIAIESIKSDYTILNPRFNIEVVNYESLHIVQDNCIWDLIICDEAHSMGAFPKPSDRAKMVRDLVTKLRCKMILMSGTPTPESYSQMYHQVYGIPGNPFSEFSNFYRFCDKYVKVSQKKINGMYINDYSNGLPSIVEAMLPYTINYSQAEAGFASTINETVLEVSMKSSTYDMIERLKKDLVIEGRTETILADTPVKLMMKVHQLCSGTIKFESGNSMVLDTSKAEFIKKKFHGKKIGIFYKFKEELNALKDIFGDDLTTELSVFKDTDKSIALQIVSGREGISLKEADCLVYYNIDFSATSYWQSRDRMTTKERLLNNVYWIFSKDGIEKDIYKAVTKKKDYTVNHFKKTI